MDIEFFGCLKIFFFEKIGDGRREFMLDLNELFVRLSDRKIKRLFFHGWLSRSARHDHLILSFLHT